MKKAKSTPGLLLRHCLSASRLFLLLLPLSGVSALCLSTQSSAQSLCAQVSLEIDQSLTLERQAFDAKMSLSNVQTVPLQNFSVTLVFMDQNGNPVVATSDPNNLSASFFYSFDSTTGPDFTTGTGTIPASSSAVAHWLIIPAAGAAGSSPTGQIYQIGAHIQFSSGSQTKTIDVVPATITVKPMPKLQLDYFIPHQVDGDDPMTQGIEASVPFTFGIRILNTGVGIAKSVTIDTAQPKIVDNKQGLDIAFSLIDGQVNGQPAAPSLLLNFGDIAPNKAAVGAWDMTTSLAGTFTNFQASVSHSNELGGELTALISTAATHYLVHNVLVDLPGRDSVPDFLTAEGLVLHVFESDGVDEAVADRSSEATLSSSIPPYGYTLTIPPAPGLALIRIPLAVDSSLNLTVQGARRADGKVMAPANVWISKVPAASGGGQPTTYLNIFDQVNASSYAITLAPASTAPTGPVLAAIPNVVALAGGQVGVLVSATDPSGVIPTLTTGPLPVGATFTQLGGGNGRFDWQPTANQIGRTQFVVTASNGTLSTTGTGTVMVVAPGDNDGDGMPDAWEVQNFGSLSHDGSDDTDNDGTSDLEEFLNGTNPNVADHYDVPGMPAIVAPAIGGQVATLTPTLKVSNASHAAGRSLLYLFEVFDAASPTTAVASGEIAEGDTFTSWTVAPALVDGHQYLWHIGARDVAARTEWEVGRFSVNTGAILPLGPRAVAPLSTTVVPGTRPTLQVETVTLPGSRDSVVFFEVYQDAAAQTPVTRSASVLADGSGLTTWQVDVDLLPGQTYYWRALLSDRVDRRIAGAMSTLTVDGNAAAPTPVPSLTFNGPVARAADDPNGMIPFAISGAVDTSDIPLTVWFDTTPTFSSQTTMSLVGKADSTSAGHLDLHSLLTSPGWYYVRMRPTAQATSAWTQARVLWGGLAVAPLAPAARNPRPSAWVQTNQPVLSVLPDQASEGRDPVRFEYEIYLDKNLTQPANILASAVLGTTDITVNSTLITPHWYFWRGAGARRKWTSRALVGCPTLLRRD